MRILYLAHRIPYPPNKGDKLRAFRQLERLAQRHRVWCACFVDTTTDYQWVPSLREFCAEVAAIPLNRKIAAARGLTGLALGGTLTESFYHQRQMTRTIQRWSRRAPFDAVVAFSSGMAPYAIQLPTKRRVLDMCDLDSLKWKDYATSSIPPARWAYQAEGNRLARREREWIDAFDATILITRAEADALEFTPRTGKLHIIGNGVLVPPAPEIPLTPTPSKPPTVGFVGMMDYKPNVEAVLWFVEHCWPTIQKRLPSASFRIVGRSPIRAVRLLQHVGGIEVVGEVDDVFAELRGFDVSVAPLQIARGLQNKVLEAMAAGKPVVVSSGAARGIDAKDQRDFLIADGATATINSVVKLLTNSPLRHRIGSSARQFVTSQHRWDKVLDQFELVVTGSGPASTKNIAEQGVKPAVSARRIDAVGAQ